MNLINKKIHLIGIGGICIGGIAKILIEMGCKITGSDLLENNIINNLRKIGAKIYIGHSEDNINKNIDFVIYSSAIKNNNVEIIKSKILGIKLIDRGEVLKILTKKYINIAISGSHGKTTTTSILINIFKSANIDLSYINGGIIKNNNFSSKLGKSNYFIVEADESDSSFLKLNPSIVIITNIDNDHIRFYNNDINILIKSFIKFSQNIKKNGFIVACIDNINVKKIINKIENKIYTYGFNNNADFTIKDYKQDFLYSYFKIINNKEKYCINVKLKNILGKHNSLNATASIIVSLKIDIPLEKIIYSINNFPGVLNRMDILGKFDFLSKKKNLIYKKDILFISDYGHHPNEIAESIFTVNKIKYNKIIMIFQPHKITRTYDLKNDFVNILYKVDFLILLDIYKANENLNIINSLDLFNLIKLKKKNNIVYCNDINNLFNILLKILKNKNIVLCQGAGDIHKIIKLNLKKYKLIYKNI